MGRSSIKQDKNIYQISREMLHYTREKASEELKCISAEKIEKIESGKTIPYPDDVLAMSKGYKKPELCNYYCSNECAIGKLFVPEIKIKHLSQVTLEMLASLNSLQKKQERLIEITVDEKIGKSEIADFVQIQKELSKISSCVESLRLWVEQTLANGMIDQEEYEKEKSKQESN